MLFHLEKTQLTKKNKELYGESCSPRSLEFLFHEVVLLGARSLKETEKW